MKSQHTSRLLAVLLMTLPRLYALDVPWAKTTMTREEMETFLKKAKVQRSKEAGRGITGSLRVTLSDGNLTHEAHFQSIDTASTYFQTIRGSELNFRDTYKFNIAGYKLDQILGLNMVPMSVERKYGGKTGAMTWWVDDVQMDEIKRRRDKIEPPDVDDWNKQMSIVRVFDQLIHNTDRNLGNLLITKDWKIIMIDHTRAFRMSRTLEAPKNITRCDRVLFQRLKELTEEGLMEALKPYVRREEVKGLIARRDQIVKIIQGLIAEKGEAAVLYDYLPASPAKAD